MKLSRTIEIALADDHTMIRSGIKALIEFNPDYKVVMEADHGMDLVTQLMERDTLPDLCFIDLNMNPLNGYETQLAIKKKWPQLRTIILSMYDNEVLVSKLLEAGANSFLSKNLTTKVLHEAIEQVTKKGYYNTSVIDNIRKQKENKTYIHINNKELQFLCLCYKDLGYKEVAQVMQVEPRTVENYRDSLYGKLKINTRAGLAAFARTTGLVDLTTDTLRESGLMEEQHNNTDNNKHTEPNPDSDVPAKDHTYLTDCDI